jgi:urease accessory protein
LTADAASGTQLLDLLQVVDRSFPTGGFVHSHGLEWLVKNSPLDLERLIRLRLEQQFARFELIFLIAAYRNGERPHHNSPPEGEGTAEWLDARFHAMLLPYEARDASMRVGRQLLHAAADLYPDMELQEATTTLPYAHHPVVFGLIGRVLGLDTQTAASVYAFQAVRGQISAAQRLTRLGQVEAQRLLHRLKPAIQDAADTAMGRTLDQAAPFMPLLDVAAMAHERAPVRLFVS